MEHTITKIATIERDHRTSYSICNEDGECIGNLYRFNNRQEWIIRVNDVRTKSYSADVQLAIAIAKEILTNQGYTVSE